MKNKTKSFVYIIRVGVESPGKQIKLDWKLRLGNRRTLYKPIELQYMNSYISVAEKFVRLRGRTAKRRRALNSGSPNFQYVRSQKTSAPSTPAK